MKFFTRIALLFYMMTVSSIGLAAIVFVVFINPSLLEKFTYYLTVVQQDNQLRMIVGLAGLLFILLSVLCAKIISGAQQKERTIAFDNPNGRVSISLFALEDMVKRLIQRETEVKEGRANIVANKKGLDIETKITFKSDVNIPQATARLQDLIKDKIQEMIGLEEPVMVRIHVMKIITEESKSKKGKAEFYDKPEQQIPFQGYRA